VGLIWYMLI